MAPIALEGPKAVDFGQYKEQSAGPRTYVKEIEEHGSEGQPAAAVSTPN